MSRFGSMDVKDRFFGAAVYLFAIHDALGLSSGLRAQFPTLEPFFRFLWLLVTPINVIYRIFNTAIPLFGSLVVFFILFIGALKALGLIGGLVFIFATGASLFCMVECALGRYAEIPTISAAAHSQLRR